MLKVRRHFTFCYCPWSNGAVEGFWKELGVARAFLYELQLPTKIWPDLFPIFQSTIINTPSPSRQNIAPITVSSSRPARKPIKNFIQASTAKAATNSEALPERYINTVASIERMGSLQPFVHELLQHHRCRTRDESFKVRCRISPWETMFSWLRKFLWRARIMFKMMKPPEELSTQSGILFTKYRAFKIIWYLMFIVHALNFTTMHH